MNYNIKCFIWILSLFFSVHSLCAAAATEGLSPELLAKVQAKIVEIELGPQPLSAERQEFLQRMKDIVLFEAERPAIMKQFKEVEEKWQRTQERFKKANKDF